jgi:DNA/RNA-binding domain of Phe-tRNA-synthetase-like protein
MASVITLTSPVLSAYPEVEIRLVVARGLRNEQAWADLDERVRKLEADLASGSWAPFDETSPVISSWHDAYRSFGSNPRRTRPSVDALSRRLRRSGRLPRINPAVDAYNLISVTHGTPAGAFDLTAVDGDISIRFANEDDTFTPLGEPEEQETPHTGEVIYARDHRVLTRHWNHRDADQTKVTADSRSVVFILERVTGKAVSSDDLIGAQRQLARLVTAHADDVVLAALDHGTPVVRLGGSAPEE